MYIIFAISNFDAIKYLKLKLLLTLSAQWFYRIIQHGLISFALVLIFRLRSLSLCLTTCLKITTVTNIILQRYKGVGRGWWVSEYPLGQGLVQFFIPRNIKHVLQNTQNDCHQQMSDSSRVHQIRFRPGFPGPRWGSLPQSP